MAKLTGKIKAAFLARMKRGKALKARGGSPAAKLTKSDKRAQKKNVKRRALAIRKEKAFKKQRDQQHRNTRKRRNPTVAKKRSSSKKSRFAIPSVVKKAAAGIGLATIATVIVSQFAPQAAPIVRPIAAFAGGGVVGVISDIFISGGGLLGSLLGGFGLGGQQGVDNGLRQSV